MRYIYRAFAILALAAPMAYSQEIDRTHGRISFAAKDGLIKGTDDQDWSYATVNSLVLPGDSLWADEAGVLELEFSSGSFVRLADGSKVDVVSLPPNGVLRAWNGAFYVQRTRHSSGSVFFETPVGKIQVDPDTQVRVDVLAEGATTVSVRWGNVRVSTDSGQAIVVGQGQRTYIDPGYLPSAPAPFNRSEEDSFDEWNRERARLLAVGSENIPIIDNSYEPPLGTADLNSYGDWVYVDNSYYWRPTVVREYVPYRAGYWSYAPRYGYTWSGHYPFDYVTSHYGYWDYHHSYGWIWGYNPYYRPAYCATIRYGDYFVWSPYNRYNRPVHYGFDYYNVGGFQFSFQASSFIYANDFYLGNCGYNYIHDFNRSHITNIHADNVFIWNIYSPNYGRHDRHGDRLFSDPTLRVRDYSPRVVNRGLTSLEHNGGTRAATRVASLESSTRTRTRFDVEGVRNAPKAPTSGSTGSRIASTRNVSIDRAATADTNERVRQATRTSREARSMVTRQASAVPTLTNSDARVTDGVRSTRSTSSVPVTQDRGTARVNSTRESAAAASTPENTSRFTRGAESSARGAVSGDAATQSGSARVTPRTTRQTVGNAEQGVTDAPAAPRASTRNQPVDTAPFENVRPTPRTTRQTVSGPAIEVPNSSRSTVRQTTPAPESNVQTPSSNRFEAPQNIRVTPRVSAPEPTPRPTPTVTRQTVTPAPGGAGNSVTISPEPSRRASVDTGATSRNQSRYIEPAPAYVPETQTRFSAPETPRFSTPSTSRYTEPAVSEPSNTRFSSPSTSRFSTPSTTRSSEPTFSQPSFSQPSTSRFSSPSSSRVSQPSFSSPSRSSGSSSVGSSRSSGRSVASPGTSRLSPRGVR